MGRASAARRRVVTMAWRNVWRQRRRSLVAIAAMSLGLLAMIVYAGLAEGFLRDMERNMLDLELGDLQVFADDYRRNPSIYTIIEQPEVLLAPLESAGFSATARLLAFGMAAAGDSSAGVSFRGIDVERDARVSQVYQEVARGGWLDPADPHGVVIGRRLSRMLGVGPGGELIVLTQGADGSMAYDLYRVRGVLRSIGDATDRTGIFMTEAAFRELLVLPRGVHQIIVRGPAGQGLSSAAAQVRQLAPDFDVQTWRQLMPTLASLLDSYRGIMLVMFLIVYLAIGILILNAMLMAVFERIREFGMLKALGVGPGEVLLVIVVESAILTGIALLAGLALSVPSLLYLSRVGIDLGAMAGISIMGVAFSTVWHAVIVPSIFTGPVAVLLVVVAAAVVYPALKAALISPVEAMRYH